MPLPARAAERALNPEIERLIYQVKVILEEAEGLLHGLREDQFRWTPEPGLWSMAQCFDHLNVTNRALLKNMDEAVKRGRAEGKLGEGPYTYGFLGRWLHRNMMPPVKKRFKAPKHFLPQPDRTMTEIVQEWQATHWQFEELLKSASGVDLAKVKMTSPVTSLLKYNLGMGFWIWTAHDKRHLWQARNVRNDKRFPA